MFNWVKQSASNKIIASLVALAFIATMFTCFSVVTNGTHTAEKGQICETVVSAVDNIILQNGITILLLVVAAALILGTRFLHPFTETQQKLLTFYHSPPPNRNYRPREYSYLSLLFSRGLIHSKLYNIVS